MNKLTRDCINKLRSYDMKLYLHRFYVIKNKINNDRNGKKYEKGMQLQSGEKLRPIGSPDLPSAVISKAFTDCTTFIYESDRPNTQHGYRPEKGVSTVLSEIIKHYLKNKEAAIVEYDFKSYFNSISLV